MVVFCSIVPFSFFLFFFRLGGQCSEPGTEEGSWAAYVAWRDDATNDAANVWWSYDAADEWCNKVIYTINF